MITITKKLDMSPHGIPQVIHVSQYDSDFSIQFKLYASVGTLSIESGTTAEIRGTKGSGTGYSASATLNTSNGTVTVAGSEQMTAVAGRNTFEIVLKKSGKVLGSANFCLLVERAALDADTITDASVLRELNAIVEGAETATQAAENAENAADRAEAAAQTLVTDDTLTHAGQPADAKAVGDEIRQTKSDLNNSAGSLFYQQYASGTSGLMPFRVKNGDTITVKRTDDSVFENAQLRFYDFNRNLVNHLTLLSNHGTSRTAVVNLSSECFYIGITVVTEETPKTYVIVNKSNEYYQKQEALKQEDAKIHETINELSDIAVHKNIINRFNPSTIHDGKYININNGTDAINSDFFASDYIYIGDLESITVSYTHLFGWYDSNKNWLGHPDSMGSRSVDKVYAKPADAVYMRFSTYNSDVNIAQIGESVDRASYVPYGKFTIHDFVNDAKEQIVVDITGNGDYTSFTEALYENVNSGVDVIVKAGTYDIVDEYITLFGQEAVDNMADSDSAIFNGFQYGVKITNRKVEFASGAHLICDWTGHTVDGTHRFSALAVGMNAEIIGLDLDCTATFYAIHDDYGNETNEYTNIYRFCRVIGHSMTNVNCIGGGCKPHSRHIIDNCYFDNNTSSSTAVRFHNTNAAGAEPEIYVSNSFFNTYFRANWYGNQTSKMRVYVNNCYAKAIHKGQESSGYTTDNVELYKWNNTETNPVE